MDAVMYHKERNRMCDLKCAGCHFSQGNCKLQELEHDDPAEAVRIVEDWSKAHPIQTRRDKFKEVFGANAENMACNLSCTCMGYPENCTDCAITAWWDAPYEMPKGE